MMTLNVNGKEMTPEMMQQLKEKGLDKNINVIGDKQPFRSQQTMKNSLQKQITITNNQGELDVLDPSKKVAKGGVTVVNVKKTKAMMEIDRKNAEEKRKELELKK